MNKRRHELEENELASFLGRHIGAARENPDDLKKWAVPALLIVIAVCGVWVAYYLVQTMSRPSPGSWLPLMVAVTNQDSQESKRERLQTIAETPNEPAALWASQMRADSFLQEGSSLLLEATEAQRKEGRDLLKSAQEEFASVRAKAADQGSDTLLIRRSAFGEAQAHEALGELDEAIEIYAELATDAADSAVGDASRSKLAFLARKNAQGEWVVREDVAAFVKAYETFVPTPPAPPAPSRPTVDPAADVINAAPAPDLTFPGMEDFLAPGGAGTDAPPGGDFAPGESSLPLTPAPGGEGAPPATPPAEGDAAPATPQSAEGASADPDVPADPAPVEETTPEDSAPEGAAPDIAPEETASEETADEPAESETP